MMYTGEEEEEPGSHRLALRRPRVRQQAGRFYPAGPTAIAPYHSGTSPHTLRTPIAPVKSEGSGQGRWRHQLMIRRTEYKCSRVNLTIK